MLKFSEIFVADFWQDLSCKFNKLLLEYFEIDIKLFARKNPKFNWN